MKKRNKVKVFKILRVPTNTDRRESFFNTPFKLYYSPGKVTRPRIGKIFAFRACWDAEDFLKGDFSPDEYGRYELWRCEAPKIFPPPSFSQSYNTDFWQDSWEKDYVPDDPYWSEWPKGTVLVPSLRLEKQLI